MLPQVIAVLIDSYKAEYLFMPHDMDAEKL